MKGIKTNAGLPVDQDVDMVLKTFILRILGQFYDEMIHTMDRR